MSQPSISNARAIVGLSAAGTATRPLVAGTVNIGQPQLTIPFPTCDIAFSAKVLLSDAQTASVDLTTLAVTPSTSGTTGGITREWIGPQVDFQGVGYPVAGEILGMLVRVISGEATVVTTANDTALAAGGVIFISGTNLQNTPNAIDLTASADGTEVEIALLAAS